MDWQNTVKYKACEPQNPGSERWCRNQPPQEEYRKRGVCPGSSTKKKILYRTSESYAIYCNLKKQRHLFKQTTLKEKYVFLKQNHPAEMSQEFISIWRISHQNIKFVDKLLTGNNFGNFQGKEHILKSEYIILCFAQKFYLVWLERKTCTIPDAAIAQCMLGSINWSCPSLSAAVVYRVNVPNTQLPTHAYCTNTRLRAQLAGGINQINKRHCQCCDLLVCMMLKPPYGKTRANDKVLFINHWEWWQHSTDSLNAGTLKTATKRCVSPSSFRTDMITGKLQNWLILF